MRIPYGAMALFGAAATLRLPSFLRPLLSDDEAIYAVTADALRRGDLLYRDVVDHKPPLIYHLYQAGFGLFGPYDTHGAHLLVLIAVLLTGLALERLGRAAGQGDPRGPQRVGLVAAGLYLVFSTTWHDYDALAANCELALLAPQAAAAWVLVGAFDRQGRGRARSGSVAVRALAAGVLVGISALFKYQGLAFLGAGGAVIAWELYRRRLSLATALLATVALVLGAALPVLAYLGWTVRLGNAEATLAWFRFNFAYVGAGLSGREALARGLWRLGLIGGVAAVPYVLGAVGAAQSFRRLRQRTGGAPAESGAAAVPEALDVLALGWLVTGVIALCAGGRFFGHYFHLVLAPLSLLAARPVLSLWDRGRGWRWGLATLCLVPALVFFSLATWARPLAERWDHRDPPYEVVAERIGEVTAADDRIFVWGNSPQLYVLSRRPLGARFSFCNYVTGESPGTPTETGQRDADRNVHREAWDMLLQDLEQRRPALFVDAAAAGWDGYDKYPVSRYPRLASFLSSRYQQVEEIEGVKLYRRTAP